MLIFMLAAAIILAMLEIATAFSVHQEAQKVRFDDRKDRFTRFGPRN